MESPGQIPSPTRPQDPVSPSEHPLAPWSPASSPSPFLSLSILISIRLSIPVPRGFRSPGNPGTCRLIHRRLLPHHTSADGSPALPFARPGLSASIQVSQCLIITLLPARLRKAVRSIS